MNVWTLEVRSQSNWRTTYVVQVDGGPTSEPQMYRQICPSILREPGSPRQKPVHVWTTATKPTAPRFTHKPQKSSLSTVMCPKSVTATLCQPYVRFPSMKLRVSEEKSTKLCHVIEKRTWYLHYHSETSAGYCVPRQPTTQHTGFWVLIQDCVFKSRIKSQVFFNILIMSQTEHI